MPTIEIAAGIANWSYGEHCYPAGGRHEITDPGPGLEAALAAAASAGAIVVVDGTVDDSAVESDAESDRKRLAADEARAALTGDRDADLAQLPREVIAENDELDPEDRLSGAALTAHIAKAREDRLTEWDDRMAEAAQDAVEGMN